MNKQKLIALGIAAAVVIAGFYFKVDINAALESFVKVDKQVEGVISDEPAKPAQ